MSEPSVKTYSVAEVATHNSNQSAWVIIHHDVYDLTSFLYEHPGGEEVLLEQAGRNATDCFENIGHSAEARKLMKRYKVGEVIESERLQAADKISQNSSDEHLPTDKIPQHSSGAQSSMDEESPYYQWIIALVLGILVTIFYRYVVWYY